MKFAFLGFTKVKYMPYMHFYLDQIDRNQHEVHLIYWQRDQQPDISVPEGVTGHAFKKQMSDAVPLRKKIPGILGYSAYARKMLNRLKPDFLVVMHSTTALTVYPLLVGKYKNRYIFDYRDVTYEGNNWYRSMVKAVIENSVLSFTSSDGFRKYLPDTPKLLTSHNLLSALLEKRQQTAKEQHTPIRVSFWGLLRHQKINAAMIRRLGGDDRFELHYYGRAQGAMLTMIEEATKKYSNVFFHGEYRPEQIPEFAANTELLHNVYSNSDSTMPFAMANKYYEGLLFGVPLLSSRGSLMGDLCSRKGIGLACDPLDFDFADKLYEYYVNLDRQQFSTACGQELDHILKEVETGNRRIQEVINGM